MAPKAVNVRAEIFATRRPAMGIITAVASAPGSMAKPDCCAVKCCRFCRKTGKMKMPPKSPNPTTAPKKEPAARLRFFNTRRLTAGCSTRSSQMMKSTMPRMENRLSQQMNGDSSQFSRLPFLQHRLQAAQADGEEADADDVEPRLLLAADTSSRARRAASCMVARMPMGRLIKKIHGQV